VENSSASVISQSSPVVFPANGFRVLPTIAFILGALVVFLTVILIGGVAYTVSHGLDVSGTTRAMSAMPGVIIQSIAEVFVIAYVIVLLPSLAKTSLAGIGFRKISGMQLQAILIAIVLMFVIVTPLASALESLLHFKTPEEAIAVFTKTSGWRRAAFAFFGVVLAPAFEEAVFRLVLFNAMRRWWGFWPAAIFSSILFGLAHAQPPFTSAMLLSISLPLAVGGIVLCWIYAKTNNAWSSMITHGGFNALSLVLLVLFPQLAK
jgi:membrane protease YdiL (CAAX protease family)